MPASAPVLPRDGDLRLADALRFLAVDAVEAAKSGHPGMPLGMADVVTALFAHVLKFDAGHPTWADRDRFVLSGGHGSALLYALLHLTGHAGMPLEALKSFRRLGSVAAGHPEIDPEIGIETTTGPLGQGFATAVGMALAERLLAARFGDDLVDHRTWVTCGDGDLMEGVSHEAASLAGHLRLSKLTLIWDDNRITIDGATDVAVSDDVPARFRAYGWNVVSADGHDPSSIAVALAAALRSDRPTLIAARTTIGFGAPGKAGTSAVHGAPLGAETLVATRAAFGWTHGPFEVPADLRAAWAAIGRRGGAVREAWEARLAARPAAARDAFLSALAGDLPGLDALVRDIKAEAVTSRPKLATRVASGRVLDRLAPVFPDIVGGSADLTPSNNTRFAGAVDVRPGAFSGRYVHWGVREAGMAAAMNGLAAHGGVIPYGGTFLCFADYARPALRLAALQKLRTIFVGTHDSIGLGEDGPTHQPVEHLAALRAIPGLLVLRPCDLVETAECWQIALESRSAPSVLALSRQELPTLRDNGLATNLCRDGAYVLREAAVGPRRVTLVASGSEVAIAAEARDLLEADGVGAALVSMPCAELFLARPAAERARVLGEGVLRVGVEAAVGFGWGDVLGEHGLFVGLPGFGASGRGDDLYRHFGITPEAIVTAVRARL
ncbi:MAG: transketolase [Phyllobacteriaceae bacterium]|nr:transketolase [Phyllobacteriaceae bacterium]